MTALKGGYFVIVLSRSIRSSIERLMYPLTDSPAASAADLIASYFSFGTSRGMRLILFALYFWDALYVDSLYATITTSYVIWHIIAQTLKCVHIQNKQKYVYTFVQCANGNMCTHMILYAHKRGATPKTGGIHNEQQRKRTD